MEEFNIERTFKTGTPPVLTQPTSFTLVLTRKDTGETIATTASNPMPGIFVFSFTPTAYGLKYSAAFTTVYQGVPTSWTEEITSGVNSILPLDYVLSFLEIHKPKQREIDWINRFQPMIQRTIANHIGYDPIMQDHTDIVPNTLGQRPQDALIRDIDTVGNRLVTDYGWNGGASEGGDELSMPNIPIRCVHHLYENRMAFGGQAPGDFDASTELFQGQDFFIDWTKPGVSMSGILKRIYMRWPTRVRTVKVEYCTGYSQEELLSGIASGIGLAMGVSLQYFMDKSGRDYLPVTSESLGGFSHSFAAATAAELPREAKKLLRPYFSYARF